MPRCHHQADDPLPRRIRTAARPAELGKAAGDELDLGQAGGSRPRYENMQETCEPFHAACDLWVSGSD